MAAVVDATVAGATANSYVTLAEANAYNDEHVSGASFTAATDDTKSRAVITATRLIDAYVAFTGAATTSAQALQWPRMDMVDPVDGEPIDSMTLPPQLKYATSEYARILIAGGDPTAPPATSEAATIEQLKAGSVEVRFRDPATSPYAASGTSGVVVPSSVLQFLRGWISASTSSYSRKLERD